MWGKSGGNPKEHVENQEVNLGVSENSVPPICKPDMADSLGDYHLGLSENVGLLNPMVNDHYPY